MRNNTTGKRTLRIHLEKEQGQINRRAKGKIFISVAKIFPAAQLFMEEAGAALSERSCRACRVAGVYCDKLCAAFLIGAAI
jgi:hypothetical protein